MNTFEKFVVAAPILLLSMVAHEYAHGYAAFKQGDDTAFKLGRLTWNPVKHIDPFMTVLLPALLWISSNGQFVFGGAKPVPVDPRKYRHYRRGDIIVSLAGVATNLVLAGVFALAIVPLGLVGRAAPAAAASFSILQLMMLWGIQFNLLLVVFNLLPIPPLDGSHVVKHLLPARLAFRYQQIGRYGLLILMLLLWVDGPVLSVWLAPASRLFDFAATTVSPYLLPSDRL
jgi:Zn-dependent protease